MPKKTVSIFGEIIGYDSVKKQLLEIADIINNPEKYGKFGVSVPHGLLLIGEPGLGKTLMATCLLEAIPSWNKYILRKTKQLVPPNENPQNATTSRAANLHLVSLAASR